ncbi:GPW/gp25 family protein [Sphingomonas sp. HF-S4]|uniref:GPW/gp25 family protein n=1 Tax=Sphingomonas agrestis TaxID=3080540 RepID=A0ABU3Y4N3_9SPHN|nr:GPW/gp25 family protein [Sphingomonas sp. HF-S4]MDV3456328.1 GPW/gp25 family protein [Sphingomonas sp. HF-S4]
MMSPFGKSLGFPPRVGADGRMRWSQGEANVRESIAIILKTEAGERIQLPGFGAGLGRYLFEPNNPATHVRIAASIEDALKAWEPRISLDGVDVAPDPTDATAALATIAYRLVATGAAERTSVSIPLGRS